MTGDIIPSSSYPLGEPRDQSRGITKHEPYSEAARSFAQFLNEHTAALDDAYAQIHAVAAQKDIPLPHATIPDVEVQDAHGLLNEVKNPQQKPSIATLKRLVSTLNSDESTTRFHALEALVSGINISYLVQISRYSLQDLSVGDSLAEWQAYQGTLPIHVDANALSLYQTFLFPITERMRMWSDARLILLDAVALDDENMAEIDETISSAITRVDGTRVHVHDLLSSLENTIIASTHADYAPRENGILHQGFARQVGEMQRIQDEIAELSLEALESIQSYGDALAIKRQTLELAHRYQELVIDREQLRALQLHIEDLIITLFMTITNALSTYSNTVQSLPALPNRSPQPLIELSSSQKPQLPVVDGEVKEE